MSTSNEERLRESDRLYEQYGTPFEAEHWGEYIAISPQGKTVLAPTLIEVMETASERFGPGSFIFKVGERAVGTI